jgi:hypothetical protein
MGVLYHSEGFRSALGSPLFEARIVRFARVRRLFAMGPAASRMGRVFAIAPIRFRLGWICLIVVGLTPFGGALAADREAPDEPGAKPAARGGARSGSADGDERAQAAPSIELDDFSVPDEASFEPFWDSSAYPDLQFTTPGCALDVAGGRRQNALGSEWFFGAFIALPLGGPCLERPRVRSIRQSSRLRMDEWPTEPPRGAQRETLERSDRAVLVPLTATLAAVERSEAPSTDESGEKVPRGPSEVRQGDAAPAEPRTVSEGWKPTFIAELVQRLRHHSGAQRALGRLDRLVRQERSAGLLPELRLRGAYGIDQSLTQESTGNFSGEATSRGGLDSVVEARLTFHLERLLAPQGTSTLERLRQDALEREAELVELGLELLTAVGESEALGRLEELSEEQRVKQLSRATAARMRLHVLTDGWFPLEAPAPTPGESSRDLPVAPAK